MISNHHPGNIWHLLRGLIYNLKVKVRMPPRIPNIWPTQLECGTSTAKNHHNSGWVITSPGQPPTALKNTTVPETSMALRSSGLKVKFKLSKFDLLSSWPNSPWMIWMCFVTWLWVINPGTLLWRQTILVNVPAPKYDEKRQNRCWCIPTWPLVKKKCWVWDEAVGIHID